MVLFGDRKAAGDEDGGAWVDEDVRFVGAIYRTVGPKFPVGVNKMVI